MRFNIWTLHHINLQNWISGENIINEETGPNPVWEIRTKFCWRNKDKILLEKTGQNSVGEIRTKSCWRKQDKILFGENRTKFCWIKQEKNLVKFLRTNRIPLTFAGDVSYLVKHDSNIRIFLNVHPHPQVCEGKTRWCGRNKMTKKNWK